VERHLLTVVAAAAFALPPRSEAAWSEWCASDCLHSRRGFGDRDLRQILDEPLQDAASDIGMRHLPAAEEDGRFHLVAFFEEALDVLLLN
jgi:hypothetical protein